MPPCHPPELRTEEVARLLRLTQAVGYAGPGLHRGFDHTAMAADLATRGPFLRRVFTLEGSAADSPYGGGYTTDPAGCHYFPLGSVDAPPAPALTVPADRTALLVPADPGPGGAGGPVLVPRTHDEFACQVRAATRVTGLTEEDVYLAALPAGTDLVLGCPGILGALAAGGTVVLADDPEPAEVARLIAAEGVTVVAVDGAAAGRWFGEGQGDGEEGERRGDAARARESEGLRLVQVGGSGVSAPVVERLARVAGCAVQRVSGGAGGPLLLTRPGDAPGVVAGTWGRPLTGEDEIRVVGADGAEVPVGDVGELVGRGPYLARGVYRGDRGDPRSRHRDGWVWTGRSVRWLGDGGVGAGGVSRGEVGGGGGGGGGAAAHAHTRPPRPPRPPRRFRPCR
ncbi:AMP-binding protein, partial [Streptomyces sp. NPDC097619]|uniref:AMP-binding protein n=1 Tax=Streptomyces sp. NPDC097619 TaxID=3157228 RepID=UPI0033332A54